MTELKLNQTLCFNAQLLLARIARLGWRRGGTLHPHTSPCCMMDHLMSLDLPLGQASNLIAALQIVLREQHGFTNSVIRWNDDVCTGKDQAMNLVRVIAQPNRPGGYPAPCPCLTGDGRR